MYVLVKGNCLIRHLLIVSFGVADCISCFVILASGFVGLGGG
jgi:hypothetical protein